MRILHVNSSDLGGGAERIAQVLRDEARAAGHEARLAVGRKLGQDAEVSVISDAEAGGPWRRFWLARGRGKLFRALADPLRVLDRALGREDFRHPASRRLGREGGAEADIVHLHNLHGGYFDLRGLPELSRRQPTFVTLHDPWLLTGHCAHPFGCERWEHGCGDCPDLDIYPAIRRDGTAGNWRRKAAIYGDSRIYAATPSLWLSRMVERSMLRPAIAESRVIPNGVDLEVFHPERRELSRRKSGFDREDLVVLFAAKGLQRNRYRDHDALRSAIEQLAAARFGPSVRFVAFGERSSDDEPVRAPVRFVPFQQEPRAIADYYRSADLFVHATRADTYPNVVMEACACGTPVVASRVGGIPEQIVDGLTGDLVPVSDGRALAAAVGRQLEDRSRRQTMGSRAAREARTRFDAREMARAYLRWYDEALLAERRSADQSSETTLS